MPSRTERDSYFSRNTKEDAIIEALDQRMHIEKLVDLAEKLDKRQLDPSQALTQMSPMMVIELLKLALAGQSENTRFNAVLEWLDRAGYTKVQKHAIATVDASQPKEALLSLIMGAKKELEKQGIQVVDDVNADKAE